MKHESLLMPEIIDIDEGHYLLRDVCVNTDEEYYEDMNQIHSVFFSELVVEPGDAVVITVNYIDIEKGGTFLDVCNVNNRTRGYVILNDTYLSDDRRYYAVHHIAHIFRKQEISNATFYWYLWRDKE